MVLTLNLYVASTFMSKPGNDACTLISAESSTAITSSYAKRPLLTCGAISPATYDRSTSELIAITDEAYSFGDMDANASLHRLSLRRHRTDWREAWFQLAQKFRQLGKATDSGVDCRGRRCHGPLGCDGNR